MGAVLVRAIPWQWAYIGFGLFAFSIFLFLLFQKASTPQKKGGFEMKLIKSLMTEKPFSPSFLSPSLIREFKTGSVFWMVTFLKEIRGLPISLASYVPLSFLCLSGPGKALFELFAHPIP